MMKNVQGSARTLVNKFSEPATAPCSAGRNRTRDFVQLLALDSEIFGYPVAKILPDKLTIEELAQITSQLKEDKVRLAFWASDPDDAESQRAARRFHGFLADKKVTFVIDIGQIPKRAINNGWEIEEYAETMPCSDLENLAIEVGRYSRFRVDPRIPKGTFLDMYRTWIRNSVNRQVADMVLVVRQSGRVVGMVTLGVKNGRGDIGLFAVDPVMRRKNLGVSLVFAAQEWTRRSGLRYGQVVTQGKNVAACKLYEKCGYAIDKVEYFYHFWL